LHHLNQVPLFGKQLQVNYSKHQNVQMPKGNEEEPGKFTRDYSNSPLHRYRVANSKNYQHITAPSPLLFVANVPTNATDEQLRDLFAGYGSITNFRTHS
jgi:RNA recognition motif-containing protein